MDSSVVRIFQCYAYIDRNLSMQYDLNGKVFRSASNTGNGEVGKETLFHYHQSGSRVWASYSGGSIIDGHLFAIKKDNGQLHMYYHHINDKNEIMVGSCVSTPSLDSSGNLIFTEQWQWLTGDKSSGTSVISEVKPG